MKILIVEPYYTGSHKQWADGYKKYSNHEIKIISMKGQFWKWRMHGGSVTLAKTYVEMDWKPDLIFCSDMLDLSTFLSLTRKQTKNIPVAIYFHENQISYPWSPKDRDVINKRDNHYGFINYTSALSADKVFFNSNFHMNSFLDCLKPFLKSFPDNHEIETIKTIKEKSKVLPVGLELSKFKNVNTQKSSEPVILWNHRWEYDKNPEFFFNTLKKIKDNGLSFKLIIVGESFGNTPEVFEKAKIEFEKDIIEWGYLKTFSEYAECLYKSDILPVTSNQEFFGVSVMEAIYCGVWPILPERLSYNELFPDAGHKNNFYSNDSFFYKKIERAILDIEKIRKISLQKIPKKYDWVTISKKYDQTLDELVKDSDLKKAKRP